MNPTSTIQVFSLGEVSPVAEGLFRRLADGRAERFPAIRVVRTEQGYTLVAALPEVAADDLDVSVMNDRIIVRGTRGASPQAAGLLHDELGSGLFERTVVLPGQIDRASAVQVLADGVLRVDVRAAAETNGEGIL